MNVKDIANRVFEDNVALSARPAVEVAIWVAVNEAARRLTLYQLEERQRLPGGTRDPEGVIEACRLKVLAILED